MKKILLRLLAVEKIKQLIRLIRLLLQKAGIMKTGRWAPSINNVSARWHCSTHGEARSGGREHEENRLEDQ